MRRNVLLVIHLCLATFIGGTALSWLGQGSTSTAQAQIEKAPKTVHANAFVLEDAKGERRGSLSVDELGPRLSLLDDKGRTRVVLSVAKSGPGFVIYDERGDPCIALSAVESGPVLMLSASQPGKSAAMISVAKDRGNLWLFDKDGHHIPLVDDIKPVRVPSDPTRTAPPQAAETTICPSCRGSGTSASYCRSCNGTGKDYRGAFPCSACRGGLAQCFRCGGTGHVSR